MIAVDVFSGRPTRAFSGCRAYSGNMLTLVIVLLAAWLILSIVGFAIQGILWIGVIGVVLFVATAIIGWTRHRASRT